MPFLVLRLRLERALDCLYRPVDEGGSAALRPGGLTPEGYLGFVKREKFGAIFEHRRRCGTCRAGSAGGQAGDLEENREKLFAMWVSTRLSLQLAVQVRPLHEPAESESDADRVHKTWDTLRNKLKELPFAVQYSEVTRTRPCRSL